jgi:hypothetical protein
MQNCPYSRHYVSGGAIEETGRRWPGQVAITCAPLRRACDVWPAEVENESFGRSIGSHVRQRLKPAFEVAFNVALPRPAIALAK